MGHSCPSRLSAAAVQHGRRLRLSVRGVPHRCPPHPPLAAVSSADCTGLPSCCPAQLSATCVPHRCHMSVTAISHSCPPRTPPYAHCTHDHATPRPFRTGARDTATPPTAAPHTAAPPTAAPRTRNPMPRPHSAIRDVAGPSHSEMMLFAPKSGPTWRPCGDHVSGCVDVERRSSH
jgi:hypothetical protein